MFQEQELVLDTEESRLILTGVSVTRLQEDIEGLKTEVLQLDNKMKCSIQQVIVIIWNVMFLITRQHPCINAMHRGIDCRWKYTLHFKLESQKELISAMNTTYQQ